MTEGARRKKSGKEEKIQPSKLDKPDDQKYVLYLYVTGMTSRSTNAIMNIKRICERELEGRYELKVIDIYQQPELARGEQLVATPTLVKKLPQPLKKIIGDLSNTERVLVGLDLRPTTSH